MKLAQCIETYVGSPKLKQAAKSTAALGNDETHYERRFPQQELRELGGFLKATIEWLEHDLSLDSFIAESARDK